jgi:hypothetical protein
MKGRKTAGSSRVAHPDRAAFKTLAHPPSPSPHLCSPFLRTPSIHARSKMGPVLNAYHASAPPPLDLKTGIQFVGALPCRVSLYRPFLAPSIRWSPSPVSSLLALKLVLFTLTSLCQASCRRLSPPPTTLPWSSLRARPPWSDGRAEGDR